jgi:hypothetical protein
MVFFRAILLTALITYCAASGLHAQIAPCLDRSIPVNVYTDKGVPVIGLTAANFRGAVRRNQVQVVAANYDTGPRRIVLLLDVSRSMIEDNYRMRTELTVARALTAAAPPQDSFALLTFTAKIEDSVGFGLGKKGVFDELNKLDLGHFAVDGWRKTAIFDALSSALDLLAPSRIGDAIYLITDGGDNASQTKSSDIKKRLQTAGVRLYGFLLVAPPARTRPPEEGPGELPELASESGGTLMTFEPGYKDSYLLERSRGLSFSDLSEKGRAELLTAATRPRNAINSFYRLDLRLSAPLDKPRDLKLEALEDSGKLNKHVLMLYPQRLMPCTDAAEP